VGPGSPEPGLLLDSLVRPPSEHEPSSAERHGGEWSARLDRPPRSVFGNFVGSPGNLEEHDSEPGARSNGDGPRHSPKPGAPEDQKSRISPTSDRPRATLETALARSFIYRFLARAFEDPTSESWRWLSDAETVDQLRLAVAALDSEPLGAVCPRLLRSLEASDAETFLSAYLTAFGHAARGVCPLNEIEYGELKADPLIQPHRLADLAAFYCAFGMELAPDADERQDHLCLELEFLCVLAAKEAFALANHLAEELESCVQAQREFARNHFGRWVPAFSRRLAGQTDDPVLAALSRFLGAFAVGECARLGVRPGSDDLPLRPVDPTAESQCDACGLAHAAPGGGAGGRKGE
jgi:DMSO reductase family type II enzyme chaperone